MEEVKVGQVVTLIVHNEYDANALDETDAGWVHIFEKLIGKELVVKNIHRNRNFNFTVLDDDEYLNNEMRGFVLSPYWVEEVDNFEGN